MRPLPPSRSLRTLRPTAPFPTPRTGGAVLLSALLLEVFWMWKETIVSTWPFSTASAALQGQRGMLASTRGCSASSRPKRLRPRLTAREGGGTGTENQQGLVKEKKNQEKQVFVTHA